MDKGTITKSFFTIEDIRLNEVIELPMGKTINVQERPELKPIKK